jgi:hypothetical protein
MEKVCTRIVNTMRNLALSTAILGWRRQVGLLARAHGICARMMARVRFFVSGYAFREWVWKVLTPEP